VYNTLVVINEKIVVITIFYIDGIAYGGTPNCTTKLPLECGGSGSDGSDESGGS
jgi:hypothetical protein